jgi:hypothetical protein
MHTTKTANKEAQHADASWVACAGVNAAHIEAAAATPGIKCKPTQLSLFAR